MISQTLRKLEEVKISILYLYKFPDAVVFRTEDRPGQSERTILPEVPLATQ